MCHRYALLGALSSAAQVSPAEQSVGYGEPPQPLHRATERAVLLRALPQPIATTAANNA